MTADFPNDGVELTHILVVGDLERARTFYADGWRAASEEEPAGWCTRSSPGPTTGGGRRVGRSAVINRRASETGAG
jgi:hypothetical protein